MEGIESWVPRSLFGLLALRLTRANEEWIAPIPQFSHPTLPVPVLLSSSEYSDSKQPTSLSTHLTYILGAFRFHARNPAHAFPPRFQQKKRNETRQSARRAFLSFHAWNCYYRTHASALVTLVSWALLALGSLQCGVWGFHVMNYHE